MSAEDDEIARRRAERAKKLQESGDPDDPGDPDAASSIEERAQNGAKVEEDDGQFAFEVEGVGQSVKWASFIPRNLPIEYRFNFGGKSVKGSGGLLDPKDKNILMLARCVVSAGRVAFERDDKE